METIEIRSEYPNGVIIEYAPVNENGSLTNAYCTSWLLLPAENLWPQVLRGILYVVAIMYIFIGIAIGSDVFMTSIEVITSKKRTVVLWDEEKNENVQKEVLIWNETVANLTLLALGSSAPEILLAIVETINELTAKTTLNRPHKEDLGFYTIVGSAAFNLLVISGICIISVPSPEVKRVKDLGVFILTSLWSLLAYVWLLCILLWSSPNVVEIWEAWVTLMLFPVLVMSAYAQDHGWWMHREKIEPEIVTEEPEVLTQVVRNGVGLRPMSSRRSAKDSRGTPYLKRSNRIRSSINGDSISLDQPLPSNAPLPLRVWDRKSAGNSPALNTRSIQRTGSPAPPVYKPFARARFRHAAIQSLVGARPKHADLTAVSCMANPDEDQSDLHHRVRTPKLMSVVSRLTAMQGNRSTISSRIPDSCSATTSFIRSTHTVLKSACSINVDVLLHRRKRAKGKSYVASITNEGKFDAKMVGAAITVDFETREGSAKMNKDFTYTAGSLAFLENEFAKTITIPIINDNQYHPDTDFYILLKNPSTDAMLGDPSVSRITIIDDHKPGDFAFVSSQFYADMENGLIEATVVRQGGSDGCVSVHYTTIDGSATGGETLISGIDFIHASGRLSFQDKETKKMISVSIEKTVKGMKNFVICLRDPSIGSHLGEFSAAVMNLNITPGGINDQSKVIVSTNKVTWGDQLRSSLTVGGEDIDEMGVEIPPPCSAYFFHMIALPWKVFFALGPPQHLLGGYPAFVTSILSIGLLTSLIEQLGHLLGCVANLRTLVTGVTLIALGTSLPDTMASRSAALHDNYADASIGNITGSNSVNVFLGLGVPWVIKSMYYWANGNKEYRVNTDGLQFTVMVFDSFGTVCVIILVLRRYLLGGELGGGMVSKWLSGILLFVMWMLFIVISSMKAYDYF